MDKYLKELEKAELRNTLADDASSALRGVLIGTALFLGGFLVGTYAAANKANAAVVVQTSAAVANDIERVEPLTEYVPTEAELPEAIEITTVVATEAPAEPETEAEHWESLGTWKLTAYCPEECCNGRGRAWKTASGAPMEVGRTVAVGSLPFGTEIKINGHVYTVEDRGVTGHHVDILHESHRAANNFGIQHAEVWVKR